MGLLTEFAGGELVGGNTAADIRFRAFRMDASEPRGTFTGVIPGTITKSPAIHLSKAGKDVEAIPIGFQRLQRWGEGETRTLGGRGVLLHDHAGRVIDEAQPNGGFCGCTAERRHHGVQQGQCQCGTQAAQNGAAGQRFSGDDHFW